MSAAHRRLRHIGMGMPAPAVAPNPAAGAVLHFSQYRSTRPTTMIRGIAIALFGIGFLSRLDRALFYGRNTEAALRLMRDISRGFGLWDTVRAPSLIGQRPLRLLLLQQYSLRSRHSPD